MRTSRPRVLGAVTAAVLLGGVAAPLALPAVGVGIPAVAAADGEFAVTIQGQPTGGTSAPRVGVSAPTLAWSSARDADAVVELDLTTTAVAAALDQVVPASGSFTLPAGSPRGTWTWTISETDGTVLATGSWLQTEGDDPVSPAVPGLLPVTPAGASSSIEFNRWTIQGLVTGDARSYHSMYAPWQRTESVVLDVGHEASISSVVVQPFQHAGRPFAAPVDVEVQVSSDPTFATFQVLGRRDDIDNPAGLPLRVDHGAGTAAIGRYVRVVVPELGETVPGLHALVLRSVDVYGEVLTERAVTAHSASTSIEFNGFTLRGLDTSDARSYHSLYAPWQRTEWVVLDLATPQAVAALELVPEQRDGRPFGAPVDVRVEVSDDPSFATSTLIGSIDDQAPADRIAVPTPGGAAAVGRYVRVLVPELGDTVPGLKALVLKEIRVLG